MDLITAAYECLPGRSDPRTHPDAHRAITTFWYPATDATARFTESHGALGKQIALSASGPFQNTGRASTFPWVEPLPPLLAMQTWSDTPHRDLFIRTLIHTAWHSDVPLAPLVNMLECVEVIATWFIRVNGWGVDVRPGLTYADIRAVYLRTESVELTGAYCHRNIEWDGESDGACDCINSEDDLREALRAGAHLYCAQQYRPRVPVVGRIRVRDDTKMVAPIRWQRMMNAGTVAQPDNFVDALLEIEATVYNIKHRYTQYPAGGQWLTSVRKWGNAMVAPEISGPWGREFT